MKLISYNLQNDKHSAVGIFTDRGVIPLSTLMPDAPNRIEALIQSPYWEKLLKQPISNDIPAVNPDSLTWLPPIHRPGKILCVGLNYRDHALEGGRQVTEYPTIFLKASSAIIGHRQTVHLPQVSQMVDFEAELAVVIGEQVIHCSAEHAYKYIAGYTILNDITARDYQRRTSQWTMGKSCDTFAPLGPVLVTADEIEDPHNLEITSTLNGNEMQRSNTRHLIFSIPFLIEYISSVMTLEPGDIISTGTPAGVGSFREPPVFLKSGDMVAITVEKIGSLQNPVL
jgi:acylpyruvate hydrolase